MSNTDTITQNANLIYEAAKRLKAAANRYSGKAKAERDARNAVRALQQEAHDVTTAMVNGDNMDGMRDLATIQKELQKANNKVDKAIEKGHSDKEEVEDAHRVLMDAINGNIPGTESEQEAA